MQIAILVAMDSIPTVTVNGYLETPYAHNCFFQRCIVSSFDELRTTMLGRVIVLRQLNSRAVVWMTSAIYKVRRQMRRPEEKQFVVAVA